MMNSDVRKYMNTDSIFYVMTKSEVSLSYLSQRCYLM